jgi:putative heme-binding domain-containing protein
LSILAGLADGLHRSNHALSELLDEAGPNTQAFAERLPDLMQFAARRAGDVNRAVDERIDAVRVLGLGTFATSGTMLEEFLRPQQAEPLQVVAVRTLGEFSEPNATVTLLRGWSGHSPAVRRAALDAIFRNRAGAAALLDAIETGQLPRAEIEPARRDQLFNHPNAEINERARVIWAVESIPDRRRVVADYADVLTLGGDRTRGEALFAKHCLECHTVQGVGKAVGPELVGVRKRERAALLEDLLNPNAALPPAFVNYVVSTNSGRVLTGIIVNETAGSITLRRAEAVEDTVARDDIDEIRSTSQSLMPEGLEKSVSRQELADLIEYLKQIQ